MEELTQRIERAKTDGQELDRLVSDYLPFIKKEIGNFGAAALEYDDKLSLGMLVFMNCVKQYDKQRGGFLSYTSLCLRNRLTDEARKLGKTQGNTLPLSADDGEPTTTLEEKLSLAAYDRQLEQQALQEEIAELGAQLAVYGLSFPELAEICPRQTRSRALCARLARSVLEDGEMLAAFQARGRLPQKELARQAGVSEKSIEKYRRYIVALLVILQGNYPGIGAYIPGYREVT